MKQVASKAGPPRSRLAQSRLARFFRALHRRGEEGMAIAEYAIGILIVAAVGFVVFTLIRSDTFSTSVGDLVATLFRIIGDLW